MVTNVMPVGGREGMENYESIEKFEERKEAEKYWRKNLSG